MKEAIENHLHDQSPAVRDAAIELIGKYVVQSPELSDDYYQVIADRIAVRAASFTLDPTKLASIGYGGVGTKTHCQVITKHV